jgi:hypothetical protein
VVIQFDNRLPDASKLAHLLQHSGAVEAEERALVYWTPSSDPSDSTKYVAAYDSDLLVGIGRIGDKRKSDEETHPDHIVVLPAYENREISNTISKLLHARSFTRRYRAL